MLFPLRGSADQIDGRLARRWHVESAFGKIADPLADRLLMTSRILSARRAAAVGCARDPARDVLLITSTPFFVGRGYRLEVNIVGKAATRVIYASLALVMAARRLAALALLGRGRARDRAARARRRRAAGTLSS